MSPLMEKRLLQAIVGVACLIPLTYGGLGVLHGPRWLKGVGDVSPDLDSHFRYVSGIFLGVGIGFVSCVPRLEARGGRFRLLGALVVCGGLARLYGMTVAAPSLGHVLGLAMELGVVPLLMLWQAGLARRYRAGSIPAPYSAVGE